MIRHIKVKKFVAEAKTLKLTDEILNETMAAFLKLPERGQQKFSLGAGLYKLRIATNKGRGKSGGARGLLIFKKGEKIIWTHLFTKNDKGNITEKEFKKLKMLANILLNLSDKEFQKLIDLGELIEVIAHD